MGTLQRASPPERPAVRTLQQSRQDRQSRRLLRCNLWKSTLRCVLDEEENETKREEKKGALHVADACFGTTSDATGRNQADRNAPTASVFNFGYQDGEDSYKLVDNKPVTRQRFGPPRRFQQRFQRRDRDPRRDIGPEREGVANHAKDRPPRTRRGNFQRFGRWNRDAGKVSATNVQFRWKMQSSANPR